MRQLNSNARELTLLEYIARWLAFCDVSVPASCAHWESNEAREVAQNSFCPGVLLNKTSGCSGSSGSAHAATIPRRTATSVGSLHAMLQVKALNHYTIKIIFN